jgi:hypothetical protein
MAGNSTEMSDSEMEPSSEPDPASAREPYSAAALQVEEDLAVTWGPLQTLAAALDRGQNQGSGVDGEQTDGDGDRERDQQVVESSEESDSDRRPVPASLSPPPVTRFLGSSLGSWPPLALPFRHSMAPHAGTHTQAHAQAPALHRDMCLRCASQCHPSNGMPQDWPVIDENITGSIRALREYPQVWLLAGGTLQALRPERLRHPELRAMFTMVHHASQRISGDNWLSPGCNWCGDAADLMCQGPPGRDCLGDQWGVLYLCNECIVQFRVCRVCIRSMEPITLR